LVNKNDGIKNTNMVCKVREVTNINENITVLENVKNLTPPLDVQETQNILNDRYVMTYVILNVGLQKLLIIFK